MAGSRTIREWLADTPPHHFSRKRAWRTLIQTNRLRRRLRGAAPRVGGMGEVQRILDHEPWGIPDERALHEAKTGLRLLAIPGVLDDDERMDIATGVDQPSRCTGFPNHIISWKSVFEHHPLGSILETLGIKH